MATTLNVRFRSDAYAYIERLAAESGLSRARVVEMIVLAAEQHGWTVRAGRAAGLTDVHDDVPHRPL